METGVQKVGNQEEESGVIARARARYGDATMGGA
jgi:hypothetical protein